MKNVSLLAAVLVAVMLAWASFVRGQGAPILSPVPKACETPGAQVIADSPLPNIVAALKERKKITILAIGSTSASLRGPVSGGHYAIVERAAEPRRAARFAGNRMSLGMIAATGHDCGPIPSAGPPVPRRFERRNPRNDVV